MPTIPSPAVSVVRTFGPELRKLGAFGVHAVSPTTVVAEFSPYGQKLAEGTLNETVRGAKLVISGPSGTFPQPPITDVHEFAKFIGQDPRVISVATGIGVGRVPVMLTQARNDADVARLTELYRPDGAFQNKVIGVVRAY